MAPKPYDVLVVGGDAASLLAALDCARIGLRVVVLATPASAHRPTVFSNRDGIVASLLTELDITFTVRESSSAQGSIVGIPANPFAPEVRAALGWRGAWRVYLDRVTPLLTIGAETNLGTLVRRRMGPAVVTALVNPALAERYGRAADDVTVAAVVPGLNQAMTRAGSLTTGVIELILADPRVSQTLVVDGGIDRIEAVVREKLAFFAADIFDVTHVELTLADDARFSVTATLAPPSTEVDVVDVAPEPGTVSLGAQALLLNPSVTTEPDGSPEELVGEVGITPRHPGLESAAPASRTASSAIRRLLLSDPKRLPLGPRSLEG